MKKTCVTLCALCAGVGMHAQTTFTEDGTTYTVTGEKTVEITEGYKKDAFLTVPGSVKHDGVEYTVTAIGEKAYQWGSALDVTIPGSIKKIGHSAFQYTSVENITFNEGLEEIGAYAFSSSKCTELEIPSTVKRIGESAFFGSEGNPTLTKLTLHEGLEVIGNAAFYGNAIQELEIPASVDSIIGTAFLLSTKLEKLTLHEGLVYIGKGAFNNSATVLKSKNTTLTEINFPSTLKTIDTEAFFKMPLTSLNIPASLETLGDCAFSDSKIASITVDPANQNFKVQDNLLYSKDNKVLYLAPVSGVTNVTVAKNCLGINGGAFWNSALQSIQLPDGLLAIGYGAFYGTGLTSINFPQALTYIDDQAFAFTKISDLVFPDNLAYIFEATFFQCSQLKNITLPSNIQGIDRRAFYGCNNLEKVICKASTPLKLNDCYEGEEIFTTAPKLIVPKGCKAAYTSNEKFYKPSLGTYDNNFPVYFWNIQESEEGVLLPTETWPKDGDAFNKYQTYSFSVKFGENITIVNHNPKVYIRPNDLVYAPEAEPEEWNTLIEAGNTLTVWGADMDGFTDYFMPKADQVYFIVIPAGTVKNEAGDMNEQIVIWVYGSQELKEAVEAVLDIDTLAIDGTDNQEVARFNLDGTKASAAQKGIQIVKYANGTAKKVLRF